MLEALANKQAQLRKTETVVKGGNAAEQLQTLFENKKKAEKTNVEKWYEPLKEFLIPCMLYSAVVLLSFPKF
jgi:hypothetical protein